MRIAATYAGVRALPGSGADTYRMSRDGASADHRSDGAAGFFSVFGGKWTTARVMAEGAVDQIAKFLGTSDAPVRHGDRSAGGCPDEPPLRASRKHGGRGCQAGSDADVGGLGLRRTGARCPTCSSICRERRSPDAGAVEQARFAYARRGRDGGDAGRFGAPAGALVRHRAARASSSAHREWLAGNGKVKDAGA